MRGPFNREWRWFWLGMLRSVAIGVASGLAWSALGWVLPKGVYLGLTLAMCAAVVIVSEIARRRMKAVRKKIEADIAELQRIYRCRQ